MNRRDVLKVGLAGLGAALAQEADAAPGEDVAAGVARLRRRLDRTRDLDLAFVPRPDGNAPTECRERAKHHESLVRSSMRALLLTGGVMDLGENARDAPEVRGLVDEMSPELDHALHGALGWLETMSPSERASIQRALRDRPELADEVAQELEQLAGKGGASTPRRLHLRNLLRQSTWQLTHRPLEQVIGEAVDNTYTQSALIRASDDGTPAPAPAPSPVPPPRPNYDLEEHREHLRHTAGTEAAVGGGLLVGGAALLGLGVATSESAVGVVAIGVSLVVLTAAVVMLIIALVTVIVAACLSS